MADKRLVHDILSESDGTGRMQRRPVAFIQHGNKDDGFVYECVCPWCGQTTGPKLPGAAVVRVIGGLYRCLLKLQKEHWYNECKERPIFGQRVKTDFAVEIAKGPLNTEVLSESDRQLAAKFRDRSDELDET